MASSMLWASRAASYLRISVFHRGFSTVLKDLKYVDSHEWVKVEGNSATIGITDHAQDHLGDVVYVELPEVGAAVKQGESFGAVESVKATSDVNSPVSGKVVEVNEELSGSPAKVNSSPYEDGWIIKVEMKDAGELKNLMDSEEYSKFKALRADALAMLDVGFYAKRDNREADWLRIVAFFLMFPNYYQTIVPNLSFDKEMTLKSEKHFKQFEVNAG
ncbi:hypothetical protein CXB51_033763 [Gossypium anomalum]|uniref:Glycine cleavage system H protein n=1 Tax=Gossypium anomalum TaxID=47600 RepID=A0A8J6CKQ0_9ROSI|nr:hypothetical protein CXB51_033763 [Gossypium anomalum]